MRAGLATAVFGVLLGVLSVQGGNKSGGCLSAAEQRASGGSVPWREMDYGPCLAATIEVAPGNVAYKGLTIRLDPGPGGIAAGEQFVVFDTDTLRYAGGWRGAGFIDWQNVAFDGQHAVHSRIVGRPVFLNQAHGQQDRDHSQGRNQPQIQPQIQPENPSRNPNDEHQAQDQGQRDSQGRDGNLPGWADTDGSFADRRLVGRDQRRYGPLPREWGRWHGHYVHGSRVILRYEVGSTPVLDHPSSVRHGSLVGFLRTLNVGPRSHPLVVQVASGAPGGRIVPDTVADRSTSSSVYRLLPDDASQNRSVPVTLVAASGDTDNVRWQTSEGQLRLELPAGTDSRRIAIVCAELSPDIDSSRVADFLASIGPPADLAAFTSGGPSAWPHRISTQPTPLGTATGPFTAEEIPLPDPNPYRSWMRTSAFDFFADGDRAAVCTWQGDVWLVQGLRGRAPVEWARIAAGLFQPLGLRIVDDKVYVTGRDQLTRLVDVNGDGATDYYENFNNDAQVTDHFHEFAMDLQTDAAGNFYYAKAARHALDALVPQHGTLIKVSPDGRNSEIVANGFRAPNGVCVNSDGTFFLTDQEGHWTPKNRINWVRPGGFYGNQLGWHEGRAGGDFEAPVCWIHNDFDRSPAQLLRIPAETWGPLAGQLLSVSYGTGEIFLVLTQPAGASLQGGLIRLPLDPFPTGIMRGRFHPTDRKLYVCGMFGWSSNQTQPGGLYRVHFEPTRPLHLPIALGVHPEQVVLRFAAPLNVDSAADPGNYAVHQWNYRRTANYGSDDYRVSNSRRVGRDRRRIRAAHVADDRRSVTLEIPELTPSMQLELRYRLQSEEGTPLDHRLQQTIHTLGGEPSGERQGAG